jgi:Cu-Zn family superoxide dismutase
MKANRIVLCAAAIVAASVPWRAPAAATDLNKAKATLRSCADPTVVIGSALLVERPSSEALKVVEVFLSVRGLTEGKHAVHIHETGACEPCSAAGSHLDLGPAGQNTPVTLNHPYHSGDLPNLTVDERGRGTLLATTSRVALSNPADRPAGRELGLLDENGSSIVIHALPDAYCPDPADANCAGGGRAACGVIVPN